MSTNTREIVVEVPSAVKVGMDGKKIWAEKAGHKLEKAFNLTGLKFEKNDKGVALTIENANRIRIAGLTSIATHIRNMVEGLEKGYMYKLVIVFSHFPINITQKPGIVEINNFLGEKQPRIAKVLGKNTVVQVKGKEITVKGNDLDGVSQTAANLENACRIVIKDSRRFQDGVYIVQKKAQ